MRMTVGDLLIEARGMLPHRPGPAEALAAQAAGALLVDFVATISAGPAGWSPEPLCCPATRWSGAAPRVTMAAPPEINDWAQPLILICDEGFQSSLAAATLRRLGLINATDLAVLELMAEGLHDDAIAHRLGISTTTVRRQITAVIDRLGVKSPFAAGAAAQRRGWIG